MGNKFDVIPITIVMDFIEIRRDKRKAILLQKYEEAAYLRDKEVSIIRKFEIPKDITDDDILQLLRDRKINIIIDE